MTNYQGLSALRVLKIRAQNKDRISILVTYHHEPESLDTFYEFPSEPLPPKKKKTTLWTLKDGLKELLESRHLPYGTSEHRLKRWITAQGLSQFNKLATIKERLVLVGFEEIGDGRKRVKQEWVDNAQVSTKEEDSGGELVVATKRPRDRRALMEILKSEGPLDTSITTVAFSAWLKKNLLLKRSPIDMVKEKLLETGFGIKQSEVTGKELVLSSFTEPKNKKKRKRSAKGKRKSTAAGLSEGAEKTKKMKLEERIVSRKRKATDSSGESRKKRIKRMFNPNHYVPFSQ